MLEKKEKNAKTINKLKKKSHKVIIAILIGNNIANVSLSAIATYVATRMFGASGVGIAVGIITLIILICGEVTPKIMAVAKAKKFMKYFAKPIEYSCYLFAPLIFMLENISKNTSRIFGIKLEKAKGLTEEELKTAVIISEEKGIIDKHEKKLINNLFDFSDTKVDEILTPKSEVIMINKKMTVVEFVNFIKEHRYSRFPIYENKEDNIVGIVYAKDILANISKDMKGTVNDFIKKPYFVHEDKEIGSLMEEMRKRQQHMSIVVNEYGVVEGIVTLEDILEEIVGEIEDEKDMKKHILPIKDKGLFVDGLTKIEELEKYGVKLPEGKYNTINGYLTKKFKKIPEVGDKLKHKKYEIIVKERHRNRISKIFIKIKKNK